jgi:hypothetical protein
MRNVFNTIEEAKEGYPKLRLSWYWSPKSACICKDKETGKFFIVTGKTCVNYRIRKKEFVEYLNK